MHQVGKFRKNTYENLVQEIALEPIKSSTLAIQ